MTTPAPAPTPDLAEVTLHVYDLGEKVLKYNQWLKKLGTGLYHGAVEVYGIEWSFGYNPDPGATGVFPCTPTENTCFVYKQAVRMGKTALSEIQIYEILGELEREWMGETYHLLHRNCTDFSNEFCKRLGVGPVPGWIKSAAGAGARIDDVVHLRPLQEVVQRGQSCRQRAGERGGVVDFTVGLKALLREKSGGLLAAGKEARGADPSDRYHFGDLSRGIVRGVGRRFSATLSEGKKARDGAEDDRFRFLDFTRGTIAQLAKNASSSEELGSVARPGTPTDATGAKDAARANEPSPAGA